MIDCPDCEAEFLADASIQAEWRWLAATRGPAAAEQYRWEILAEFHEHGHAPLL